MTDFTKRPPTHPVKVPKLIRDRIPEFHARDGCHSVVKVVQDDRVFEGELMRKLTEEVVEFLDEPSDAEMADVLEVVRTMAILKGIIPAPDTPMQKAKREQNGGFEKRLLLTEFAWGPEP